MNTQKSVDTCSWIRNDSNNIRIKRIGSYNGTPCVYRLKREGNGSIISK